MSTPMRTAEVLTTERLLLRPWLVDDARAALGIYGHAAATVRKNGMHWVGGTTKYFGVELQVFRLRMADLDQAAPTALQPPDPHGD